MRYLKLYVNLLKMNIKVMLQYKYDYMVGIISTFLMQVMNIIFIEAVFYRIDTLNGWTKKEVVLLYGMFAISRGISHIFCDNLWIIGREFIRRGTFDIFMIRPANVLFQIVAQKFQVDGIGTLCFGFICVAYARDVLYGKLNAENVIYWLFMIFLGALIIALINLIFSVSSFWTVKSNNVIWLVYSFADFAQYPLSIYPLFIKGLLTCIIPYGFVSYYPLCIFMGKCDDIYIFFELIIICVLILIAKKLWKVGMLKYESTGN